MIPETDRQLICDQWNEVTINVCSPMLKLWYSLHLERFSMSFPALIALDQIYGPKWGS